MKTRINVWITTRSHDLLNELSIRDGRSLSDLLREAIRDYLEAHQGRLADGAGDDKQVFDSQSDRTP